MSKTFNYPSVVIESFLRESVAAFPKSKWTDSNKLEFINDKKESIGTYEANYDNIVASGKEIEKFLQGLVDKFEESKKELSEDFIKKSTFKNINKNQDDYSGLLMNPTMFKKLDADLKKLNISEVVVRQKLNSEDNINKKLVLNIEGQPNDRLRRGSDDGYYSRLRKLLFDKLKPDDEKADSLMSVTSVYWLNELFPKEKRTDVMYSGVLVGHYYNERNLIHLYFNPFLIKPIIPSTKDYPSGIKALLEILADLKPEIIDTDALKEKIFAGAFIANTKNRVTSVQSELNSLKSSIKSYEESIMSSIRSYQDKTSELEYLSAMCEANATGILKDIESIKKLPFVTDVAIGTENIKITYQETCLTIPAFKRIDHGKSYGTRTMYLGPITVNIKPGGFEIGNTYPIRSGYAHTHANGNPGSPCFGSGDGRNKIYELIASFKFSEAAKFLWFWIKTHRDEGSYIKMWDLYEDRLARGLPVFDEKGNRILANEEERIKSGEQRKINLSDDYKENLAKFKDFKMC